MLFATDATQRRAAGSVDERRELHRALVPRPPLRRRLDDPEHVCGVDGERVLARRARELPGADERVAAATFATCAVLDAPTFEQETDATASVVGPERRVCVVERPVGVVEAALEPLCASELRQNLRESGAVVLRTGAGE